jgi:hypothetical protein
VIERTILLHHEDDVLDVFKRPGALICRDGQSTRDTRRKRSGNSTGAEKLKKIATIRAHWDTLLKWCDGGQTRRESSYRLLRLRDVKIAFA